MATTHPPPSSSAPTTSTSTSPVKPGLPLSLIQPTYRKPSPNLIVDVAETCQERFPFEEVARRHNAPVDKVFDVFAAIIQVPLLRCPTDRRRAGKLATQRIREYAKARKDILSETSSSSEATSAGVGAGAGAGGSNLEKGVEAGTRTGTPPAAGAGAGTAVITPLDIAQRMGTVGFPQGFHLDNTDG
ncbi:hypothetical protein SLS62_007710 [Diatrype stigma]|uniref:Uncharacterized protein n=1 Tax=Diatrype stigma TaxID=117547 RepID=A0AAN9YM16_9PEZI